MNGKWIVAVLMLVACALNAQPDWPPKGTIGTDYNVKDAKGLKQGLWYRTYSGGGLYYAGYFKDSKPIAGSTLYYFYEDGKIMATHAFRADPRIVDATHYHKNGLIQSVGKYLDQKKDSTWVLYSETGTVAAIENFSSDQLNGERMVFYPEGKELRRENYVNDVPHGPWVEFFEDGKKKGEGNFVEGKLEGKVVYYHPSGTKASEGEYLNDLQHGQWFYFHANGKIHVQVLYENGEQLKTKRHNGDFIDYYPSGIPQLECSYQDGELHGPFTEWYDKGEFVQEPRPVETPGASTEFIEKLSGQQRSKEGEYKAGKLDGDVLYFSENGDLVRTEVYDNGKLIETIEP